MVKRKKFATAQDTNGAHRAVANFSFFSYSLFVYSVAFTSRLVMVLLKLPACCRGNTRVRW